MAFYIQNSHIFYFEANGHLFSVEPTQSNEGEGRIEVRDLGLRHWYAHPWLNGTSKLESGHRVCHQLKRFYSTCASTIHEKNGDQRPTSVDVPSTGA
jgi:hypothetical protein